MPRSAARFVITAAAVAIWASIGLAQVGEQFDTSRRVSIKGTLAGFTQPTPGATYLVIEMKDAAGQDQQWVLRGDNMGTLMGSGWKIKGLPLGQTVAATGFALKPNVKAIDLVPPDASDSVLAAAKAGRFLHGVDVTFPDGRTLPFGPAK